MINGVQIQRTHHLPKLQLTTQTDNGGGGKWPSLTNPRVRTEPLIKRKNVLRWKLKSNELRKSVFLFEPKIIYHHDFWRPEETLSRKSGYCPSFDRPTKQKTRIHSCVKKKRKILAKYVHKTHQHWAFYPDIVIINCTNVRVIYSCVLITIITITSVTGDCSGIIVLIKLMSV